MNDVCDECKIRDATSWVAKKLLGFDPDCKEDRFNWCDECLKEHQEKLKEHMESEYADFEKEIKDDHGITLVDNCICGESIPKDLSRCMRRFPNLCRSCQRKEEERIIIEIQNKEVRDKYGE